MTATAVTPSPGFVSIAVTDVVRSAAFYEKHLGAVRDTFDFGPDAVAFVGWPTFAISSVRRPGQAGPSPETTTIQLWWRASDAQALHDSVAAAGVPILVPPFDGRSAGSSRWPTRTATGSRSTSATSRCSGRRAPRLKSPRASPIYRPASALPRPRRKETPLTPRHGAPTPRRSRLTSRSRLTR